MNSRFSVVAALFGCTVALAFAGIGCGGGRTAPKSPDSNDVTETSSKEDMPPAPTKEVASEPTSPDTTGSGLTHAGAGGGMLTIAPLKLTAIKPSKKDAPVELKADGTVLVDNKPVAKIKGDEVDSTEGTSMLTVGVTGGLVGNGVKSGLKFEGDDVTSEDGLRLTVGDDGTISASKDGKSEPLYKVDGGGSAKRTALVLAVLWMKLPSKIGKK